MKRILPLVFLLSVFLGLCANAILGTSGTVDEIAHHIPVGVLMLKAGDLKVDTSQPPLSRYLVALPVLVFLDPRLPDDRNVWRVEDRADFGRDFFFTYNHRSRAMLALARFPIALAGLACGALVFLWAHELFGPRAGFLSLFLYVFSPDILAHASLATTDMVAASTFLLSVYALWRFFKYRSTATAVTAGLALGLAQLAKYSALVLYPIFIVLTVLECVKEKKITRRMRGSIIAIFLLSLVTVWAGYGFRIEPLLRGAMRAQEKKELIGAQAARLPFWNADAQKSLDDFLLKTPVPLGEHVLGILGVLRHGEEGHRTYFMGRWASRGTILYFPAAFVLKNPIPFLLLLIAGLFALPRAPLMIRSFLVLPPAVYFLSALSSNLQIGIRHLLPMYPFLFITAGASIVLLRNKIASALFVFLCVWYAGGTLAVTPHYLSYFNEGSGGSRGGWKYLRDSNIDWGQDLPALDRYLRAHRHGMVTLRYFGEDRPAAYGIVSRDFSEEELSHPGPGVYAISVNMLESVTWSSRIKPVAYAGGSIHIYDLSEKK